MEKKSFIFRVLSRILPENKREPEFVSSISMWLLAGLLLHLILLPFAFHSDFLYIHGSAFQLSHNGVINIYSYLEENNLCEGLENACFGYPSLTYFFFGATQFIAKPLLINFEEWVDSIVELHNKEGVQELFFGFNSSNWNALLLKLPYLFFDFGIAVILLHLIEDKKKAIFAMVFWLFNPVVIYSPFLFSQFDIIPVFFIALALLFAKKGKDIEAMVSLGIGFAFKLFPVLLIPIAAIILGKKFFRTIKLGLVGIAPFIIASIPFLFTPIYWKSLFGASTTPYVVLPLGIFLSRLFEMNFGFGVLENTPIFHLGYFLIIALVWVKRKSPREELYKYFLLVFFWLFIFIFMRPHYFIWIIPTLAMFIANEKKYLLPSILLIIFYVIAFILPFDYMTWELFYITDKAFFSSLPMPGALIDLFFPFPIFYRLSRVFFVLTSFWFVLELLKKKQKGN